MTASSSHGSIARLALCALLLLGGLIPSESVRAADNGDVIPLISRPAPLKTPGKLRVGLLRTTNALVLASIAERLKRLNVEVEESEFVRYADARTALVAGSLDVALLGPGDIAVALSQGIDEVIGLSGIGTARRYVIVRTGLNVGSWSELKNLRLGLPTGADSWVRFAAKVAEEGISYRDLKVINIQGSGQNSLMALRRGEVDAIVTWEPTESQAKLEGVGYWNQALDFSTAKATGPELGLIAASKSGLQTKAETLRLFAWAYLDAQNEIVADQEKLIAAMATFTRVDTSIARSITSNLKYGGHGLTPDQVRRHAKVMFELGILQKDVSEAAEKQFRPNIFEAVKAAP